MVTTPFWHQFQLQLTQDLSVYAEHPVNQDLNVTIAPQSPHQSECLQWSSGSRNIKLFYIFIKSLINYPVTRDIQISSLGGILPSYSAWQRRAAVGFRLKGLPISEPCRAVLFERYTQSRYYAQTLAACLFLSQSWEIMLYVELAASNTRSRSL